MIEFYVAGVFLSPIVLRVWLCFDPEVLFFTVDTMKSDYYILWVVLWFTVLWPYGWYKLLKDRWNR